MNHPAHPCAPATPVGNKKFTFALRVGQAFVVIDSKNNTLAAKLTLTGYVRDPFVWSLRDQRNSVHKSRKGQVEVAPGVLVEGRPGWREDRVELTAQCGRRYRLHYLNHARQHYPDLFARAA